MEPEVNVFDVDSLRRAIAAGAPVRYIFFWGHRAASGAVTDACLSQWWPCRFNIDNQIYSSAEQFMMWSKARLFADAGTAEAIMASPDPAVAKRLGRSVRQFDSARWLATRFDIVVRGNKLRRTLFRRAGKLCS